MGSFSDKLAAALGVPPPDAPCEVQVLFNRYKKHLVGRVICTPVEEIHLLEENFPYLIQLENPDPANPSEWVSTWASGVLPLLEKGSFDQSGFRFEEKRTRALFNLPDFLRQPNCIHKNLRNAFPVGLGRVTGEHMYVSYYGEKQRKVAFTTKHSKQDKIIVVSSFWSYEKWVADGADMPAVHVRKGCKCTCK